MTEPNFAAVAEMAAFVADFFDEYNKDAVTASTGMIATLEALRNDLEGDYALASGPGVVASLRGLLEAVVAPATVRAAFLPVLDQFSTNQAIDSNATGDPAQLWTDLGDYMHAQSQTVNAREFTHGSFAGAVTGTGDIIRLTTDERGYRMEGWWPDVYTLECVQDSRQTGNDGDEWFEFYGTNEGLGELSRQGWAQQRQRVKSLSARDSKRYVRNPSFNEGSPAPTTGSPSTPTSLPGWTDDTGSFTNVRLEFDTVFRPTPGDGNNWSLEMVANTYVYQDLVADNNTRIDVDVPYAVRVSIYRESSADGTAVIRLTDSDAPTTGGVSRSITLTGQSNATWATYWLVSSPGQNNWPRSFNADSLGLTLQWTGRTTGSIFWDDIVFHPMTRVGRHPLDVRRGLWSTGTYVCIAGGATHYVRGDTQTATDTESGAVTQEWFWRGGLGYVPSATGAGETIADK